ncbi:metal ABC transporter solute-binding protein, Zn/Mn family [Salinactinospora qingdaonensis]|uniref:Zinc transport system substrate-binding protein n=1 Tax=Salinactinospora qingdaonensis TaxID=702744 RepID=A0ABP7FU46_9ACTN
MAYRIPLHLGALSAVALLMAGCASPEDTGAEPDTSQNDGPAVVATTTWQAAFARAAGAQDVTVIVPVSVQHAPDYDPKPSDLTAVAGADFVLYSPFESFASEITEAAGAEAETVEVDADNSPDVVAAEVERLGELFDTSEAAQGWLGAFETAREEIASELREEWPGDSAPTAVSQVYTAWAAELAGAEVVQTYGPEQLTPDDVATLRDAEPEFVFDNVHMSTGPVLPDSEAVQIDVVNYPSEGMDLIGLYQQNATLIAAAFNGEGSAGSGS